MHSAGQTAASRTAVHSTPTRSPSLSPFCSVIAVLLVITLSACGTTARREASSPSAPRGGGYYLDDGPGENPPPNLDAIPDAVPRVEPLHTGASRPYTVMGRSYTPMAALRPYKARGTASWYGRRYHGKPTSSGEIYDMYAMTGAHPTLPIPSYARVTNLASGRSVIVRINDRGPFIGDRLIDLSYTAAYKLGMLGSGSALVEVESVLPGEPPQALASTAEAPPGAPRPPSGSPASFTEPVAAVPLPPAEAQASAAVSLDRLPAEGANGVYVQFGAFKSRENAEAHLATLKARIEWLAARLHVESRGGLYRVHAGPYASPNEARDIAVRIGDSLGTRPLVLKW